MIPYRTQPAASITLCCWCHFLPTEIDVQIWVLQYHGSARTTIIGLDECLTIIIIILCIITLFLMKELLHRCTSKMFMFMEFTGLTTQPQNQKRQSYILLYCPVKDSDEIQPGDSTKVQVPSKEGGIYFTQHLHMCYMRPRGRSQGK